MDLFEKCYNFTRADEVKAAGVYPYFRAIEANEGPVVKIEGRQIIMAGSNNYLGLTAHPKVREAAIRAIKDYGTGCSGSRYLTGTLDLHIKLEEKLADYDLKIAEIKFKVAEVQDDMKTEYLSQIEKLEEKRDELIVNYGQLKQSTGNAWTDIKTGTEKAWLSLEKSIEKAITRFK